ncbi:hypothetical protein P280DRAFT_395650 [Massarina eburnea CBS 473.64]|uniref:Concanavalin A-like lectin/glucanase n=1 Tax=Massarina eburnea CBS 473.64 TaxID=1395130 RepID=A0A6A6S6Y0_9PLEO|nr:hypothetical protein P280DRAFT_395650 [Massarina eburnea CBS 473.64]
MKGAFAAASALAALIQHTSANNDVVTLVTKDDVYITEAVATLVVGNIPNPITGDVALWSAIMLDGEDFLQGVTQNGPAGSGYCDNLGKNWCNFAYTLVETLISGTTPEVGKAVPTTPGSLIKTHYKLNPTTTKWDQDLYINGTLVSSVSTSKGQKGNIFYVSIECSSGTCATAPAHKWEDISIVLSKADQSFGTTESWQFGATGGKMSTADSGKTWNFTTLSVPDTPVSVG